MQEDCKGCLQCSKEEIMMGWIKVIVVRFFGYILELKLFWWIGCGMWERLGWVRDDSKVFGLNIWSIGVSKAIKYFIISTFINLWPANILIHFISIILLKWRLSQNTKEVRQVSFWFSQSCLDNPFFHTALC